MQLRSLENVRGVRRHPFGFLRRERSSATRRRSESPIVFIARGGADVAGMARPARTMRTMGTRIRGPCTPCSTSPYPRRAAAGSVINRAALEGGGFEVRAKQRNDFVTKVDHAAEAAIIETVRKAYPDHAVLAEESGATPGQAEYQWIIDPLDGTTNFIRLPAVLRLHRDPPPRRARARCDLRPHQERAFHSV